MGILFTILMGFLFTITLGILFTIVLGIQFTISKTKRSCFSCEKEGLRECPLNPFLKECPHRDNEHGFSTKMSVKIHPRLILRWHRASSVYKKIKNYRTSSERSNSTCKENDLDILERPRVRGIKRAAVLSYLSDIASFLKRVFGLIIRVTVNLRKYRETKNKKYWERLFGPEVPLYLLYATQREQIAFSLSFFFC